MVEFLLLVIGLAVGSMAGGLVMYQRGYASGRREARTALREVVVENHEEGAP